MDGLCCTSRVKNGTTCPRPDDEALVGLVARAYSQQRETQRYDCTPQGAVCYSYRVTYGGCCFGPQKDNSGDPLGTPRQSNPLLERQFSISSPPPLFRWIPWVIGSVPTSTPRVRRFFFLGGRVLARCFPLSSPCLPPVSPCFPLSCPNHKLQPYLQLKGSCKKASASSQPKTQQLCSMRLTHPSRRAHDRTEPCVVVVCWLRCVVVGCWLLAAVLAAGRRRGRHGGSRRKICDFRKLSATGKWQVLLTKVSVFEQKSIDPEVPL